MPAAAVVAGVVIGLHACEAPPRVAVTVPWRLTGTCDTSSVDGVEALLYRYGEATASEQASAPCGAGEVVLPSVPPGHYTLALAGSDADGCVTHEGRVADVDVGDTDSALRPVLLAPRARPLALTWKFSDGGNCASHAVTQVEIEALVGSAEPVRGAWLCEVGMARLPSLPAGPASMALRGLDATGATTAHDEQTVAQGALLTDACDEAFRASFALEPCASAGCP